MAKQLGREDGHKNSKFGSGNSDCSSSTLLKPTTPKQLLRPRLSERPRPGPRYSFPEIRTVRHRPLRGQQPQKRLLLPELPFFREFNFLSQRGDQPLQSWFFFESKQRLLAWKLKKFRFVYFLFSGEMKAIYDVN